MKYYVRIGKMYVQSIYVDDEAVNTNFIRSIDLKNNTNNAYRVDAKDVSKMQEILKEVLNLNEISFEEIIEEIKEEETDE